MFNSLTTTGTLSAAGDVVASIMPVILLVLGIALALLLANWVVAKVRGRGGRKRGRKK